MLLTIIAQSHVVILKDFIDYIDRVVESSIDRQGFEIASHTKRKLERLGDTSVLGPQG